MCRRGFESHPRREGPSRACVVFLKRAYEAILGTTSPVSSSFPFWMSGCISIWRWTANPLCSAGVGSNPILVVKGPQGLLLSFSNEHSRGGHFRVYITSVQLLTFPFSMSGCISIWRWTANPLCSARVGSNPILVGKGPQGLVLSFSNEHTRPF